MTHATHPPIMAKTTRIILYSIGIIMSCICAGLYWRYHTVRTINIKHAQEKAIAINKQAAPKIGAYINNLVTTVHTLASDLSSETMPPDAIIQRLKQKPASISGLGIAYAPAHSKTESPYVIFHGEKQQMVFLEEFNKHHHKNYKRDPMFPHAQFQDPFKDPVSKTIVIEYTEPLFDKNHRQIGTVFGNYTLENLQQLLDVLYPSRFGHGSVASKSGLLLVDPMSELIEQKKTVPQVGREYVGEKLARDLERAIKGEITFITETPDWLFPRTSWIIFEPIPHTSWSVYGVFAVDELVENSIIINRDFIDFLLSLFALIAFLICLLIAHYTQSFARYWSISSAVSLALLLGIGSIWHNASQRIPFSSATSLVEKNSFNSNAILTDYGSILQHKANPSSNVTPNINTQKDTIIKIPTGIYINQVSVEIDKVVVNAYVWQQIPLESTATIVPGTIFPQATHISMSHISTFTNENTQTINWSVRCTLEQNFNYSKYPFDFKHIKISLWPATFDNSTLLIPDLEGYAFMSPPTLPGMNTRVNEDQTWHFHLSYFAYQKSNIQTNFGYTPHVLKNEGMAQTTLIPQLSFNIIASHGTVSTLILHLTPIIIILILLFILLAMAPLMEFASIFGILASLFFTGLIAYTAFKNYLPIQQIVFFDYLYFTLQIVTILIAILVVAYYSKFNIRIIKYNHMLIPQLLFWPAVMSIVLLLSLLFYY